MTYNDIRALNWSTLKLMQVSPAYCRHCSELPEEAEDKPAYQLGRLVHCVVLEPTELASRYAVQPDFGDGRTKAAKEAKAEWIASLPEGIEIVSADDMALAMRAAATIGAHEYASALLAGAQCEKTVEWTTEGVPCKGRVDALTDRIIDLKTTRRQTLFEVERDAANFDYHAQLAWYHDGAVKAGLIAGEKQPVAIFVHVSKTSTFADIAILDMEGTATLEFGRGKYKTLLAQYIGCQKTGWWPGMAERPVYWHLPEWKQQRDLEEVNP